MESHEEVRPCLRIGLIAGLCVFTVGLAIFLIGTVIGNADIRSRLRKLEAWQHETIPAITTGTRLVTLPDTGGTDYTKPDVSEFLTTEGAYWVTPVDGDVVYRTDYQGPGGRVTQDWKFVHGVWEVFTPPKEKSK